MELGSAAQHYAHRQSLEDFVRPYLAVNRWLEPTPPEPQRQAKEPQWKSESEALATPKPRVQ